MRIEVAGTSQAKEHYLHLWGMYVRGFKPWHHCFACFYGTQEKAIHKQMEDGTYDLPEPTHYFYLCGVASGPRKDRWKNNLHLAVRPQKGSIATVHSVYGPVFTIHDAEEIEIQGPITTLPHLSTLYTTCKNFRFAAQQFPASKYGPDADREVMRTPLDGN